MLFDRSGEEQLPVWLDELPGIPTVLATLGTVFNGPPGIFETILDGLRDGPFNLILTVGRGRDLAAFGPLPANARLVNYIPYTLLLPRCDLVITHGGSTIVRACLMHALPLIILPVAGDHLATASRCVRAGIGVSLPSGACTSRELRRATSRLLADSWYRANARQLRDETLRLPPAAHGVKLLEDLAIRRAPLLRDTASPASAGS